MMHRLFALALTLTFLAFMTLPAAASPFFFSTGDPDGRMATASRPSGAFEIESADDFILSNPTSITSATFTGLVPSGTAPSDITQVVVEIYRVFPKDSTDPPSGNVPTRVNSPSDNALASRDSSAPGELTFLTSTLAGSFNAANSVLPGNISLGTKGNGPVTGAEVQFDVTFTTPFVLPPDHYFFVPQVQLEAGEFLWLSAPKPIVPPGTPFAPDLQSWTRDRFLAPDWLRVGTDIVGPPSTGVPAPTFNASFSLTGEVVPLPASLPLLGTGLAGLLLWRCRKPSV